jgi:hypothetical protein
VLALVVLQTIVLAVLVVLVLGLLRTHADVLRRLHDLGAGIYDEQPDGAAARGARGAGAGGALLDTNSTLAADIANRVASGVAPPGGALDALPADIAGVDPRGDAVHIGVAGEGRLTLLAFLSSGCTTCGGFWDAFHRGEPLVLDGRTRPRLVVVTKGPEHEHTTLVASRPPADGAVVMSSDAWGDYEVPASPYFVLVDGSLGVIGEGSAASFGQLAGLLERATTDRGVARQAGGPAAGASDDDPHAESRIDRDLLRAGITPGHPALYEWHDPAGGVVDAPVADGGHDR